MPPDEISDALRGWRSAARCQVVGSAYDRYVMSHRYRRPEAPTPLCGATICRGIIVTLSPWARWLVEDGPGQALVDAVANHAIADVDDADEVEEAA